MTHNGAVAAQPATAWRPLWAGPVVVRGTSLSVRLPDRAVSATAPAPLLRFLADRCDGTLSLDELLAELRTELRANFASPQSQQRVGHLLTRLADEQALIDQRDLAQHMLRIALHPWQAGSPPSAEAIADWTQHQQQASVRDADAASAHHDSPLLRLIRGRRSTRRFKRQGITLRQLACVLIASYGVVPKAGRVGSCRAVPCAGALPSLTLHVIVRQGSATLKPGIHRVIFNRSGGVALASVGNDLDAFPRAFHAYAAVRESPAVIVYSADLSISAFKYGEKSLLYALLEAGHAAQNALLAAAEAGLHTVEVGGFDEGPLAQLLRLPARQSVLTTVALGHGAPGLPAELRGSTPITTSWVEETRSALPVGFHIVRAGGPYGMAGWGRDPDPELAYRKALFEVNERLACCTLSGQTTQGRLRDVAGAIDPRDFIRYSLRQLRQAAFPFAAFSETRSYLWARAERSTGERVWIAADLVFFRRALPRVSRRRPLFAATSSGVAAAADHDTARLRALLETLERDAFMFWWMARRPPPLQIGRPGADNARRIARLQSAGLQVRLLDLTLDTVPVAAVWLQSSRLHYTTLGLGAGFDLRDATRKALDEVESQAHLFEAGRTMPVIEPRNVASAEDHLALYCQPRHYRRADWFASGGEPIAARAPGARKPRIDSSADLLAVLDAQQRSPLFVDLAPPASADAPFHAARALVPGMLPLTFGHDREPLGLVRQIKQGGRTLLEVSFASPRASFPHPFA